MLEKICTDLETSSELRALKIDLEFETGFAWRRVLTGGDVNKFELVAYYEWFKQEKISSKEYFGASNEELVFPAYTVEQLILITEKLKVKECCVDHRKLNENMATNYARNLIKLKEDKVICQK